jgi:putative ABC transport system permease protein
LLKARLSKDEINLYPNELSGGMKQRVSLCRAFLREKPILLLDEPTKELDSNNVNRILDIVREIAEKRLVIVVTHSESDIEYLNATKIQITKI